MADVVEVFQWNSSCTQFSSSCQHTGEPHHMVRTVKDWLRKLCWG